MATPIRLDALEVSSVRYGRDGLTRVEDSPDASATVVVPGGLNEAADRQPTDVLPTGSRSQTADRQPTAVLGQVHPVDAQPVIPPTRLAPTRNEAPTPTGAGAVPGRLRTNLPDDLLGRYQPLYDLKVFGGQADLVRCTRRSDGADVVVKLYKSAAQLDREVLGRLYRADHRHVVRLLEHGETDGEPWEVQEFCPLGNLAEYRVQMGGRLDPALCRAVLQQLTDAIAHVHGLGITHRDLKPANVLVRAVHPQLDLVLTDFGVAADQVATVLMQTVAASWPWAAPEVHTKGQVARSIDWWALGAIMHQLLTGRHLLAAPDGAMPSDKVQRAIIVDGRYTTDAIGDPRWRNLVDGLLAYQPADRWTERQARDWLAGGNPPVVRTVPLASLRPPVAASPRPVNLVVNGQRVRTGRDLVAALRDDWDEVVRQLSGDLHPHLVSWLRGFPEGMQALAAMQLEDSVGARWVRLQAALTPEAPLTYRGRGLSPGGLRATIAQASRWRPGATGEVAVAHDWLLSARRERVLRAAAAARDGAEADRLARADQALHRWWQQTSQLHQQFGAGRLQQLIEVNDQTRLAESYAVALGQADGAGLMRTARATAKQATSGLLPWADRLVDQVVNASPDQRGLVLAAEPVIAEANRSTAALARRDEEYRKAWARQQRQARYRVRVARLRGQLWTRGGFSVVYAIICAALAAWSAGTSDAGIETGVIVLGVCAVSVLVACAVDWLADNPRGGLRQLGAGVGIAAGAGVWAGAAASSLVPTADQFAVLPAALGAGWAAGGALNWALERAVAGRAAVRPDPVRPLARLSGVLVTLAVTSGVSALAFHFGGDALAGLHHELSLGAAWWTIDPFGLAAQPVLVAGLAAVATGLQIVAARLGRLGRALGLGAVTLASLLSLAVVFGYPANLALALLAALLT